MRIEIRINNIHWKEIEVEGAISVDEVLYKHGIGCGVYRNGKTDYDTADIQGIFKSCQSEDCYSPDYASEELMDEVFSGRELDMIVSVV